MKVIFLSGLNLYCWSK